MYFQNIMKQRTLASRPHETHFAAVIQNESAVNYTTLKHQLLQFVSQNYKINITTSKDN